MKVYFSTKVFVEFGLCSVFVLLSLTLSIAQDNVISNKFYKITLSPTNGSIISFLKNDRELISKTSISEPLFFICLRDDRGKTKNLFAFDNKGFQIEKVKADESTTYNLHYKSIAGLPVNATVSIDCPKNSPFTYWSINIDNQTNERLDYIDFPTLVVPNDLIGNNGDSRVFRPSMEGVLIEDIDMRNNTWLASKPLDYPTSGWSGYYPGSCAMQFMAYYNKQAGLYLGTHDKEHHLKGFEVYKHKTGGILLKTRLFTNGIHRGVYQLPYKVVIGNFEGNWYEAADIYRNWLENEKVIKVPKLKDNKKIPVWFEDSPVSISYPIRAHDDKGALTPNEYYPYIKAQSYIDSLSHHLQSKIIAMLMHWEGTAPWAPPHLFPPFGGLDKLEAFIKSMHHKKNLVGLYGGGLAYTMKSLLDTSYSRKKEFHDLLVKHAVNIAPDGEMATNGMGTGVGEQNYRIGYDLCPSAQFSKHVVQSEIKLVAASGIDYLEFFYQNAGGNAYLCYSKHHGHTQAPGTWLTHEMEKIYQSVEKDLELHAHHTVIACEGAAAEPFIHFLPINESRFHYNYMLGKPVPAYAYLFHEYTNNFMGNQAQIESCIALHASTHNLYQRIAYSFLAGDMLSLSLVDHGHIGWGWGTDVHFPKPNQHETMTLVRHLNWWRINIGKEFLLYGRMSKPFEISGGYDVPIFSTTGKQTRYNSVYSTQWQSHNGKKAQFVVNYTEKSQDVALIIPKDLKKTEIKIFHQGSTEGKHATYNGQGMVEVHIPAFSATMVEF
jgi:hypothetical protein